MIGSWFLIVIKSLIKFQQDLSTHSQIHTKTTTKLPKTRHNKKDRELTWIKYQKVGVWRRIDKYGAKMNALRREDKKIFFFVSMDHHRFPTIVFAIRNNHLYM